MKSINRPIVKYIYFFLDDAKLKGLAAPSNLSMNQTLEGHSGKKDRGDVSAQCLCVLY